MSAETTFWYKRYEKVPKRDNTGKVIEGFIIMEAEDCINLYDVIRGHWKDENTFVIWMRDGHEETVEKEIPLEVRKQMIQQKKEIPKQRLYLLSQIELRGTDIRRFRAASELLVIKDESLPQVIAPRAIQPEAPTATVTMSATPARPLESPTETQPSSGMTVVPKHDIDLVEEETAEVLNPDDDFAVV